MEASTPADVRAAELDAREKDLAEREAAAKLTAEEQAFTDAERAARPHVDQAPQTPDEVKALAEAFAEYRKEVAALRAELAAHRPRTVQVAPTTETPEQRMEARLALIADHTHYCPGCGALGKYSQKCVGTPGGPHKPLEMVSTDELGGDPANHTKAPATEELAA